MSAIEPLSRMFGINETHLTKEENILIEGDLFIRICEELKEYQRFYYKEYFRSIKFTREKENAMLEMNFVQLIIRDILSTEDYTLDGIAHYTNTHMDVVNEVYEGRNTNPSATFLRKLIELHRSVRGELYNMIIKKIASHYAAAV